MSAGLDEVDLYAGAGGWDEAARILGLRSVGLEIEHDPCVTAVRAGHARIRCDVSAYPTEPFIGRVAGVIASPPCQAWSMAGKRLGEQDKARVHELVDRFAQGDPTAEHAWSEAGWTDPRSHHAAQPVRWIRDLRPEWVALEQVPPVIDLWRHISDVLRPWGYSVVTGVLNAADYGVPQTRQRAILIASQARPALMPETTHERDPQPSLFSERLPWVSMAEALGWNGAVRTTQNSLINRAGDTKRYTRDTDRPAPTLMANADRWTLVNGVQENATARTADEPAGTIYCSRPGNLRWVTERPATTVQGDPRIGRPGHKDRAGGESQFAEESVRVTLAEAALLQSFPADYPWHGNKTSQFLQVGNAIPPRLATAIIGAATGADWRAAVSAHYPPSAVAA